MKWENLDNQRLFLLTFARPRRAEDIPPVPPMLPYANWGEALGESVEDVISRFRDQGVIAQASLEEHLDYLYTKDELQDMLRQRQLPVPGNKPELIARLIQADEQGMMNSLGGQILFERVGDWKEDVDTGIKGGSKDAVKWILLAISAGIIGNRADDVFMEQVNTYLEQRSVVKALEYKGQGLAWYALVQS